MKPEKEKLKGRVRAKKWAAANPERVRVNHSRWRAANKNKVREAANKNMRRWRKLNPVKAREQRASYCRRRWKRDPNFRLLHGIRTRVGKMIKLGGSYKASPTLSLLGCSVEELKSWLSGWFEPGMTWENYGKVWQLDHNFPCASFDLSRPRQQRRCFGFLNLRPLFSEDNLRKRDRVPR